MRIERLLARLAAAAVRRPRTILALALGGVLLALGLAAARLTLETSNLDLIDADLPPVARFRAIAATFGTPNLLLVVFEGEEGGVLRRAVDRVGPRLRQLPGVRSVVDKLPLDSAPAALLGLDPYLTSRDGKLYLVLVQPDDPASRAETMAALVGAVRQVLSDAALEELGVQAGLTGMPAYALDDREIIQRDISRLSLLSLGLIILLFVLAFGSFRRPLLAILALLVAVAFTLGAAALYPGHLTLLSAFFASILFGLGIDAGIHIVARVEELVTAGMSQREAIPAAVASLARGLTTSGCTTAAVLFALQFSGFRGFAELGVIAGTGMLFCLGAMCTVLPALLMLAAPARGPIRRRSSRMGQLLGALQGRPVAAVIAAMALLGPALPRPAFDTDYLNLQPAGSEAVRLERELVRRSDWSPEVAVFTAGSRQEAAALTRSLAADETVGAVRSLLDFEALGINPHDLPAGLRSALLGPRGDLAVYAYPRGNVWEPQTQHAFVNHMQAIDPEVTGMPFLGSFMVERSRRALHVAALLGSVLIFVIVLADFRRLSLTACALLPTLLTATSLYGLMGLFAIPFNPLNVMALPVILGIAVDDGVHIVHRFVAEGGDLARTLAGSGRSVVLTSATTLAAFATLTLTTHRGLASFALLLSLGVGLALVHALLVLPQLLVARQELLPAGNLQPLRTSR